MFCLIKNWYCERFFLFMMIYMYEVFDSLVFPENNPFYLYKKGEKINGRIQNLDTHEIYRYRYVENWNRYVDFYQNIISIKFYKCFISIIETNQ